MDAGGKVKTGDIHLAYQVWGDPGAPPMVLLHALGDRASDWAPVADRFAASFRVVALDMRGHGDSDWPGTYSFPLMLGDVLGALDRLGLDRVTLVGHSMGGGIAYRLASQHQDRVERLIIEDVAPPYPRSRPIPERPARPLPFDWAVVPAIIGHVNKGDPALWSALGAITAPTLLIGGGPQSHISQDKIAEAAARIPHCDLVTIPAGHNVHANRPGEFADAVLGWLAAGQGGGP